MSITEYSLGFMIDNSGNIPLLEKLRPQWQAGLINGIGGKQEDGESIHDCMVREWREETGDTHEHWEHFCSIRGRFSLVHCFRAFVPALPKMPDTNDTGEKIVICSRFNLPNGMVPNLPLLIQFATSDISIESGIGFDPRRAA